MLSSDPHAWLRPLYARLCSDRRFGLLSPAHQFEALAKAVDEESPVRAAAMREWGPDAQAAMLKWLNDVLQEEPSPTNQIELWRVAKGSRELRCMAHYLPTGIDVRLMENDGFRRTQLCRDAAEVDVLVSKWRSHGTRRARMDTQ
jgi:hypothetical protein